MDSTDSTAKIPVTAFEGASWTKSSRSLEAGNCVEIARVDGYVGVRDSKDQSGPILVFTPEEWNAFRAGVAAGEFFA